MYVQELCSSWLHTPFWKTSFMLEDAATLAKIIDANITEAWIDLERGLDVAPAQLPGNLLQPAPAQLQPVQTLPVQPERLIEFNDIVRVSMDEELGRAAIIVDKSKRAVAAMFNEARMGLAIEGEKALALVEEIAASVLRNPSALISLARLKKIDDYTYMHSVAVCALMIALARQLKLDDHATRQAGLAGLLHDIGKMTIPATILNKPGKLTDAEYAIVKQHPADGHRMLLASHGIGPIALDVCLHHHEKMDGSGYPGQLPAEGISLHARMGAVCDVYDAITSNRPYKHGWCPADSLRRMTSWSKGHFDEAVLRAFVRSIGIYPVGTLVRLASGKLGVVLEQQPGKSLLMPKVRVFFSTNTLSHIAPEVLDLAGPGLQDSIVSREDAATWQLTNIERYWMGDAARPS
jgi:putative nucleotidyltransferase with HDIG domain